MKKKIAKKAIKKVMKDVYKTRLFKIIMKYMIGFLSIYSVVLLFFVGTFKRIFRRKV